MKLLNFLVLALITFGSITYFYLDSYNNHQKDDRLFSVFSWTGRWNYNNNNIINMTVDLFPDGAGYKGQHCMVDGRIHGGALDCYFDDSDFTLTNSRQINGHVLEFDFESGYIVSSGKARVIKVSENQIRFIIVEEPSGFELSPLGNYLWLNDGIGSDAQGGIVLTRRPD